MRQTRYVTPDQEGHSFLLRYWGRDANGHGCEVILDGKLAYLSKKYREFCDSITDLRHGPATIRYAGEDCGFINASGEVYLHQPSYRLVKV